MSSAFGQRSLVLPRKELDLTREGIRKLKTEGHLIERIKGQAVFKEGQERKLYVHDGTVQERMGTIKIESIEDVGRRLLIHIRLLEVSPLWSGLHG